MKKNCVFILAILIISFASCRHTPQLDNAPIVSFKDDVEPILSGNCMQSGCHGSSGNGEHEAFSLSSYESVIKRVNPGDASGSSIYKAVTGKGGARLMPPSSQPPLTDNQVVIIYLWIEQGAQNN